MNLQLTLLKPLFCIIKLPPSTVIPKWIFTESFYSITKTSEELSIVVSQKDTLTFDHVDLNWRCFKVMGPLDFSLIGILSSLTTALANAGVSLFAVSTFDTDYILVKEQNLTKAISAFSSYKSQNIQIIER